MTNRGRALASLWQASPKGIPLHLSAPLRFSLVLRKVCPQVAPSLTEPLAQRSGELVFRAFSHYSRALTRGETIEVGPYLVHQAKLLGLVKRRRHRHRELQHTEHFVWGSPSVVTSDGRGRPTLEHAPTQDIWVTYGQCIEQHGAGEAFLPVLDALGRLARGAGGAQLIEILRTYAPMWLVQLPALIDGEEGEALQHKVHGASRERMLRELAEALERLAAEQPVILVLEDLHWSDVSTLDLLAFLARRKEAARSW